MVVDTRGVRRFDKHYIRLLLETGGTVVAGVCTSSMAASRAGNDVAYTTPVVSYEGKGGGRTGGSADEGDTQYRPVLAVRG